MDNYCKGRVVEIDEPIPLPNLVADVIHMKVKQGSRIRSLLDYAFSHFTSDKTQIVFSGCGEAVYKTISCAEIFKRKHELHQLNRIGYKKVEEYWDPKDGEMDVLKVVREIPAIYVLFSRDSIDAHELGHQAPGKTPIIDEVQSSTRSSVRKRRSFKHGGSDKKTL